MAVDAVTALAEVLIQRWGFKKGGVPIDLWRQRRHRSPEAACNSPNEWARAYWPWPRAMNGCCFCARRLAPTKVVDGYKVKTCSTLRQRHFPHPDGLDAVAANDQVVEAAEKSLAALRTGGRRPPIPNGVQPVPKERAGIKLQSYDGEYNPPPFDKVNRLIDAGSVRSQSRPDYPFITLDQAADAQRALDDHYLGKLALITR